MIPKVSVIITTYNRSNILQEAIESVLYQTYRDFELIVVDDGSTSDHTREVCMRYGNKLQYVYQKNHKRPEVARNTGIRLMKGKYAAFLDDDDLWMPKKLERQMACFRKDSNIDFISTKSAIISNDGEALGTFKPETVSSIDFEGLLQSNFVVFSSVIIKKSALDQVGYFNHDVLTCADYDFNVRVADKCNIHYLNEPLVKYRVSKDALSRNHLKVYKGELYFLDKFIRDCQDSEKQKIIKSRMKKSHYQLAKEYLYQRNILLFGKHYLMSKIV